MSTEATDTDPSRVLAVLQACQNNDIAMVQQSVAQHPLYAVQQDDATGRSPLMMAAGAGHMELCEYLLQEGAPWNAVDRQGLCAGDYATNAEHWSIVNLLVDWGVRAELILGAVERHKRTAADSVILPSNPTGSLEFEPSTKPHYLRQTLHYTADGKTLLDQDQDAVMMEWERPIMQAHAQIMMEDGRRRVLNVGFGLGIIDTALQEQNPVHHIIIEAHPDVYKRMLAEGWDKRPNVRICFGRWQEALPQLIREGVVVDAVFYDTYGEHYLDLEDFHAQMVQILSKPNGIYSFFNGLAPDNLFFHGVACQCVQLQLGQLGLDSEFIPCQIQAPQNDVWEGIRRKYWHGRDVYYLPRCTWNAQFLQTGAVPQNEMLADDRKNRVVHEAIAESKRQKVA